MRVWTRAAAWMLATPALLIGQQAPTSDSASALAADTSQIVKLNPYDVFATKNVGYGTANASSSSRLNQNYIDIPQTVNVVTAELLADSVLTDSRWFSMYEPDVTNRANAHQSDVFIIRGLTTSLLYIDGFQTSSGQDSDPALWERIEYVKGPASAAIGRGEAAGLVNYISKSPHFVDSTEANVTFGTANFYRFDADLQRIINKDEAFRVALYTQSSDNPRHGVLKTLKYGVAPSFKWNISPNTTLTVVGSIYRNTLPGSVGSSILNEGAQPAYYEYLHNSSLFKGSAWSPGPNTPFAPDINDNGAITGNYFETDVAYTTATLIHDFGNGLTYRQGLRLDSEAWKNNLPGLGYVLLADPNNPGQYLQPITMTSNNNRSREARVQGDLIWKYDVAPRSWWGGTQSIDVGYEGFQLVNSALGYSSANEGNFYTNYYTPSTALPLAYNTLGQPTGGVFSWQGMGQTGDTYGSTDGYSGFFQYIGGFFHDRVLLEIDGREDYTNQETHNYLVPVGTASQAVYTGWVHTNAPRYSLTYKPVPWLSVYGMRTYQRVPTTISPFLTGVPTVYGGATLPAATDPLFTTRVTTAPVTTMNEVGSKATFLNGRLEASVAVYHLERNGVAQQQTTTVTGYNGIGTMFYGYNYSGSGENVHGTEVEVLGVISNRLTFRASYARPNGTTGNSNGLRINLTAIETELAANLKLDLRNRATLSGFEFTAGETTIFKGWYIENQTNAASWNYDQYLVNAGVGYFWDRGRQDVRLTVNNATNQFVFIQNNNAQFDLRRSYLEYSHRW